LTTVEYLGPSGLFILSKITKHAPKNSHDLQMNPPTSEEFTTMKSQRRRRRRVIAEFDTA
jgi:hypothetical protein